MHDCVNSLKPEILQYLEKLQEKDLEQKREEERKKKLEAAEKLGKSAETQTEAPGADSGKKEGSEVKQNTDNGVSSSSTSEQMSRVEDEAEDRAMETVESTTDVPISERTETSTPSADVSANGLPQPALQGFAQPDLTLMQPVAPISQEVNNQESSAVDSISLPTTTPPGEQTAEVHAVAMETSPTETLPMPTMTPTPTPTVSSVPTRPHASAFQTPMQPTPPVSSDDSTPSADVNTTSRASQPASITTASSVGTATETAATPAPSSIDSWSMITPQSTMQIATPAAPCHQRFQHVDTVNASDLAADLAAAIMSQLATSSPTPVTSSASTAITNGECNFYFGVS